MVGRQKEAAAVPPVSACTISHTRADKVEALWLTDARITTDDLFAFARACEIAGLGGSAIEFAYFDDDDAAVVGFRVVRERPVAV